MFDALAKNTLTPLILRLGLAVMFVIVGLGKVNPEKNWGANWAGDAFPGVVQILVAWGELIGGLAIGLGLLTRLAALGLMIIMIGAIVTATGPYFMTDEGKGFHEN